MIAEHLRDGRLVSPFPKRYDSARGYFALVAPGAAERPDVVAFLRWLTEEADVERTAMALADGPARAAANDSRADDARARPARRP
jgi:hypothetical protein